MSINNGDGYSKQKYVAYPGVYGQAPPPYMPMPGTVPPVAVQMPLQNAVLVEPVFKDEDQHQRIIDDETGGRFAFSDATIRRGFIRKVYSLLMLQLGVTASIIAFCMYHGPTREAIQYVARTHTNNIMWIVFGMCGINIVVMIVMVCCESARRKSPMNFIFLGIFTLSMSGPLGVVGALSETDTVLIAAGITGAICLALTIFALQTKWDFTTMGGMLVCLLTVLIITGVLFSIRAMSPSVSSVQSRTINDVLCCLGVLLFSFYLVYDTQLMMGGRHKYAISPEEYVFAALNLYLDIISIFIRILRLLR